MMFGRKDELAYLNELYESNTFEFLIMYGRRRVGKTTILQEFAMNTNAIFFPAREKNDSLNLEDFSKAIQFHFDHSFIASFKSWEDAFEYIGVIRWLIEQPLLLMNFHILSRKILQ